jgi:hypothetical protein
MRPVRGWWNHGGRIRRLLQAAVVVTLATTLSAQLARRATTIESLRLFPGFFHLEQVVVRGELVVTDARSVVRTDEHELRVILGGATTWGQAEVRGVLLDVGRLEPDDPRLMGYDQPDPDRWPRRGEELVLKVARVTPVDPGAVQSARGIALEPWRFDGQTVTIAGQFRGRNLYGDLPGSPRQSRYDFVLRRGDAALWVVGQRPRGKGFDLDVDARVDTSQWLNITGTVRRANGLVLIDAAKLTAATAPSAREADDEPPPPAPSPPVEVVFSSPTQGEVEVPPDAVVRIQFSRNIKPETLEGRLTVAYVIAESGAPPSVPCGGDIPVRTEPCGPDTPDWEESYDPATRAVELRFAEPLASLQAVQVELSEGIVGFDGVRIVPWSLVFHVGR